MLNSRQIKVPDHDDLHDFIHMPITRAQTSSSVSLSSGGSMDVNLSDRSSYNRGFTWDGNGRFTVPDEGVYAIKVVSKYTDVSSSSKPTLFVKLYNYTDAEVNEEIELRTIERAWAKVGGSVNAHLVSGKTYGIKIDCWDNSATMQSCILYAHRITRL